jgi:hypothetical protein
VNNKSIVIEPPGSIEASGSSDLNQATIEQIVPTWFENDQEQLRHHATQANVDAIHDNPDDHLKTLCTTILEL